MLFLDAGCDFLPIFLGAGQYSVLNFFGAGGYFMPTQANAPCQLSATLSETFWPTFLGTG